MPESKKHILLMTATIAPRNAPNLARVDPLARLNDYQQALAFYLTLLPRILDAIVFVENSDSDVSSLKKIVADARVCDRVEFLCNYGVHTYAEKGRAYGEFKLLDYAMATSTMIRQAGDAGIIWKITGRYIAKNMARIIAKSPSAFDAYFDMKNRPMRWMDMRLMAWTATGYDRVFRNVADHLDANLNEVVMRDYVPRRAAGAKLVQRFRNEPYIDGVRGYDNRNYSKGPNLLKYCVRSVGRTVAPWYWI